MKPRISQQKLIAQVATLMVQPHAGREESTSPRDRKPDHIIRIDEVSGHGIKIELRKDAGENTDLPPIATVPFANQTEVFAKSNGARQ